MAYSTKNYRTDCFYFDEDHDMNATIPTCLYMGYSHEPVCAGCNGYFPQDLVPDAVEFYRNIKSAKAFVELAKEYL